MFKTCLLNRIVRGQFGDKKCYKCYLCHLHLLDEFESVQEHIISEKHSGRMGKIEESSKEDESEIVSSISESKRKKLVENCITCSYEPDTFYCHICKCEITEISQALDHIKNIPHKENLAQKQTEQPSNTSHSQHEQQLNKISSVKSLAPLMSLQNHVSLISGNLYSCEICNCHINGVANTLMHINGNLHQSKMKENDTGMKEKDDDVSIKESLPGQTQCKSTMTEIRFCNVCKVFLKDVFMVQCHVMQHLNEEINFPDHIDILKFLTEKSGKLRILCSLCEFLSSSSIQLFYHLKSQRHLQYLKLFTDVKEDSSIVNSPRFTINEVNLKYLPKEHVIKAWFCNICNAPIPGMTNIKEHKNGKKHKDGMLEHTKINGEVSDSFLHVDFSGVYPCFICDLSFCTLQLLLKHYNHQAHKSRMENLKKINLDFGMSITISNRQSLIQCKSCNDKFTTFKAAVEHLSEEKHLSNLGMASANQKTGGTVDNYTAKSSMSNSNLESVSVELISQKTYESDIRMKTSCDRLGVSNSVRNIVSIDAPMVDQIEFPSNNSLKKELRISKQPEETQMSLVRSPYKSSTKNISACDDIFINYCIKSGKMNIYDCNTELIRLLNDGVNLSLACNSGRYCFPCQIVLQNDLLTLFEHLQSHMHIANFYNIELQDKRCNERENHFSNLKLAKLFMEEILNESVLCKICDVQTNNDYDHILSHYKSAGHIKKSLIHRKNNKFLVEKCTNSLREAWYHAESFACEICAKECNSELNFVEHLQDLQHTRNTKKYDQSQLLFNLCPVCSKYWYGNLNSYSEHSKNQVHTCLMNKTKAMVFEMEELHNAEVLFNDVDGLLHTLVVESDMAILDKNEELEILRSIEDTVRLTYPKAKAYIFGPRISFLGTPDSYIQIFLDCDEKYLLSCCKRELEIYLANVCRDLASESSIWAVSEILPEVPMIKLQHEPTNRDCRIYFSSGLCVEKSKLVGFYSTACSLCRHLILYLKNWSKYFQYSSGSDNTVTLAISWCVIFYLQVQGILPPVYKLLKHCNDTKIIDGWECGYSNIITTVFQNLNFKDHLMEFFLYYSNFDYQTSVACPFLGRIIHKYDFANADDLPEEMEIYKFRASANFSEIFEFISPMCIQDPIDLSQNLTQNVTKSELRRFRKYCMESAKILTRKN